LAPLPDYSSTPTAPSLALDPATHTLYVTLVPIGGTAELLAIDTSTGIVSPPTALAAPLISLAYDAATGALIGVTNSTPHQLVSVNSATGSETAITTFGAGTSVTSLAIDPSTHTAFVVQLDALNSAQSFVASIDELSGVTTVGVAMPSPVDHLAFQPMLVTPDSIKADVRSALAGGAISNAGVANALLAQLNTASAARLRGQCATATNIYQAFINQLSAQSGKLISSAMASQLTGEARFLMANCP
jgi:DNA-binding beta-propeller fold protein YncE